MPTKASRRTRRRPTHKARRKAKTAPTSPTIDSWDDVDRCLARLGRLSDQAAVAKADADERVRRVREETAAALVPIAEERKILVAEIEAFAKAHKRDFGRKRSRTLAHGRVGWRRSREIRFVGKAADVVAALEAKGLDVAVMVTKRPSKEVMEEFDDQILADVGAKRVKKNTFYVEPADSGVDAP